MSRYAGNHEACPQCGLQYRQLNTGISWEEVRQSLWSYDADPSTWRYKRRNTILGKMHQWKLECWKEHLARCTGAPATELRNRRASVAKKLAHDLTRQLSVEDGREFAGF